MQQQRYHQQERAMLGPLPEEVVAVILRHEGVPIRSLARTHSPALHRFIRRTAESAAREYNAATSAHAMLPGEKLVGQEEGSDGALRARVIRERDPKVFFSTIVGDHLRLSSSREERTYLMSSTRGAFDFLLLRAPPTVSFWCECNEADQNQLTIQIIANTVNYRMGPRLSEFSKKVETSVPGCECWMVSRLARGPLSAVVHYGHVATGWVDIDDEDANISEMDRVLSMTTRGISVVLEDSRVAWVRIKNNNFITARFKDGKECHYLVIKKFCDRLKNGEFRNAYLHARGKATRRPERSQVRYQFGALLLFSVAQ
jgi:hypothetical protein